MTDRCPCGSSSSVRHAPAPGSHMRVAGIKVERVPHEGVRRLCKACGRTFVVPPHGVAASEREVRDHVAELAFRLGRAGAVDATKLGSTVVDRLVDEWQAARDPETLDAAPDFVLVEPVRLRDKDGFLVLDVDRETLVEVVIERDGLDAWLGREGPLPPLRACVPLDAGVAATVRARLPGATVMVAPSTVLRAIRSALGTGLRALRREPSMRRRNAFPGTASFLRAHEGRAGPGEGWPVEVTALLAAGRVARDIAGSRDAAKGEALWREFEVAVAVPGGAHLARMMATWRDAILSGLDHRFVDRLARAATRIRRLTASRRPTLLIRDYRGLVLLRDYVRETSNPAVPGGRHRTVGAGRPLEGLAELLAGNVTSAPA